MYDERTNLGQLVARDVREFFKEKVFNTDHSAQRAPGRGAEPRHAGVLYDAKSRGAAAYVGARAGNAGAARGLAPRPERGEHHGRTTTRLGKGLSALIPDAPEPRRAAAPLEVDIDLLAPNEQQPRMQIDDAQARRAGAVDQRQRHHSADPGARTGDAAYRIIAGERRWRAAQRAGLLQGAGRRPRRAGRTEQQLLELALIENIQREDLNPDRRSASPTSGWPTNSG